MKGIKNMIDENDIYYIDDEPIYNHKLIENDDFEPNKECSQCDVEYTCWDCEAEQIRNIIFIKIMQVINHVFETFYDDNNNTKHLDSDFAEQIVEVEKYLTNIFGDNNEK